MARGVTTEWEDIQVKLGNYLPREHEADGEEIAEANIEVNIFVSSLIAGINSEWRDMILWRRRN
jgi:hypothetical protein